MKSNIVKKIISYILLFLLIISFTTSIIISVMKFTILNKQYIISAIKENNYYTKTYNNIMDKFKDNTIQSGLEEKVLDGIITENQVEKDTLIIIDSIYENTETKVDTEIVKTGLIEKINKIVKENNKKVSSEEQEAINIYVNTIEKIYKDGILYKQEYIDVVKTIITKTINYLPIIVGSGILISLVLIVVIVVINKKVSIKYFSSALISSGILLLVPKVIESIHINTHNILLFNINFSAVVISMVESLLMNLLVCGIISSSIGLLINIFNTEKVKEGK